MLPLKYLKASPEIIRWAEALFVRIPVLMDPQRFAETRNCRL